MASVRHTKGFTLIELLVGMMITSIILSAVATLAFAMSVAARDADYTAHAQTNLRCGVLRVGELVRTCRLVCAAPGTDLVLWTADHNHNNRVDVNEIVYLELDDSNGALKLCDFNLKSSPTVLQALGLSDDVDPILTTLAQPETKATLVHIYGPLGQVRRITVLQGCSNITLARDQDPPRTRHLTISFDLADNGVHRYEIDATRRASAEYLISADERTLVSDDD